MTQPGDVYCAEAYALGKMLDHSAWQRGERRLPRGITGSDIDGALNRGGVASNITVFDNLKRTIFAEFSSHLDSWQQVQLGQRMVYQALLVGAPHCSVLCRHNVTPEMGRKICTRFDVIGFQPMFYDHGYVLGDIHGSNDHWQEFVFQWFDDPLRVRRRHLGKSAGYVPAGSANGSAPTVEQAVAIVQAGGFSVQKMRHADWLTRPL